MSAKRRASTTCTPASNAVSCRRHVSFCSCRLCQSVDVVGETLEGFWSGVRERGVYPRCGGGRELLRRGLCCHRSVLVGGDGELCRHDICCFSSTSCRRRSRFCLCSSSLDSSPSAAVVVLLLFCLCNERSKLYLPTPDPTISFAPFFSACIAVSPQAWRCRVWPGPPSSCF